MSLYAVSPGLAAMQGRQMIGTLHDRVGDEEQLRGNAALGQSGLVNGMWGRMAYRNGSSAEDPIGIYGKGPAFDAELLTAQAGIDLWRAETDSGRRDHAGLYGAYGDAEADVEHYSLLRGPLEAGSIGLTTFAAGAYWTHFEPNGAYVDIVAQASWYDFELEGTRLGEIETDGFGIAASIEGGYPLQIGGGLVLEPQAQVVYQNISIDGFEDTAASVRYRDLDSLAARVGVRLATQGKYEVWARANVWYEFLGSPRTEFSSAEGWIPFRADLPEVIGQIGVGASLQLAPNVNVYGGADYETTFDGDTHSWSGRAGVRINF